MNWFVKAIAIAAFALFGAPTTSHAVLFGAKTIHIESAIPDWLQVGEVIATQDGTGINVALASNGGSAIGSGDYPGSIGPGAAIDGVFPVAFPFIYHSDSPNPGEFLEVTLASPTDLSSLTLFGRTDCCSNRDIFAVTIFDANHNLIYTARFDNSTLQGEGNTQQLNGGTPPVNGIPEPASIALMVVGLVGLWRARRQGRLAQ